MWYEVQIQDQSQSLYDHCQKILEKVSQPRYYFKGQLVNFVFLKEFEAFTKQAEIGCIIKAQIKKDWYADLVLLSMTLNFDKFDGIKTKELFYLKEFFIFE